MSKETVTFRTDAKKREALDEVATALERDRSYVLNQAIDNYLDIYAWHIAHIKEGKRQAEKGEFITQTSWEKTTGKHRS